MSNSNKIIVGILALVILVGGVAVAVKNQKNNALTTDKTTKTINSSDNGITDTATNTILIENFAYSQKSLTVKVGTTVTWSNKDTTEHTVTADVASVDAPNSGSIPAGKTYSFTFNKAGIFSYHCIFHSTMTGTVVVTE